MTETARTTGNPVPPAVPDRHTNGLLLFAMVLAGLAAFGLLFSTLLGQEAANADSQSLLETVQRQQLASATESKIGAERSLYLRASVASAEAAALRRLAADRAIAEPDKAAYFQAEAQLADQVAERRLGSSYTDVFDTVTEDGAFDSGELRRVFTLDDPIVSTYDPAAAGGKADRFRRRADGVSFAVVVLAVCVTLLVFAQAERAARDRDASQPSTGASGWKVIVALVVAVVAVGGGLLWGFGVLGGG